jgi:cold shock CspA family protein
MHLQNGTTMSATDNNDDNNNNNNNNNGETPVSVPRLTGRVKWFNNKTGFGFITALTDSEGVKEGSDVFVHHSAVKVSQEQYRYLVQGEYVEFVLSKLKASDAAADAVASKHEFQAVDVSGVKGGKLICETRWESRASAGFSAPGHTTRFKRADDAAGEWTTVGAQKSTFVPRQGGGEWRRGESGGVRGRGGRGGGRGTSSE